MKTVSIVGLLFLFASVNSLAASGEVSPSNRSTPASAPQPAPVESPASAADPAAAAPFTLEGTDLGRMLRRDAGAVSIMRIHGGAMSMDVHGGFRSVMVVQITPEGQAQTSCIISEKAAERIFARPAGKAPEKPKEP